MVSKNYQLRALIKNIDIRKSLYSAINSSVSELILLIGFEK
jgi:hypothetical protein